MPHVSFDYDFAANVPNYNHVSVFRHKAGTGNRKILIVLDYMPTEDLESGRLLSGGTGKLLKNVVACARSFYKARHDLNEYNWMAIAYNGYKTAGKSEEFRANAREDFKTRLEYAILQYKPDIVLTFGEDPMYALNGDRIAKYDTKFYHLFGVMTDITVSYKGHKHECQHVPAISLNTIMRDNGKGESSALIGYCARNVTTALDGEMRYKIPKLEYKTRLVDTIERFKKMMKVIRSAESVAIDTETENLYRRENKMLTAQFAVDTKTAYVLPFLHKDSMFTPKELGYIQKTLRKYFERESKRQMHIYVNGQFDLTVLRNNLGIRYFCADVYDIFAAEFVSDENLRFLTPVFRKKRGYYSLLNISMQYGCTAYYEAEFGKSQRKTISTVDLDKPLLEYCSLDVIVPFHIMLQQRKRAKDIGYTGFMGVVRKQISDMIHMFSTWEYNGCFADLQYLFYLKTHDSPIRKEIEAGREALMNTKGVAKANKLLAKGIHMPSAGLMGHVTPKLFNTSNQKHLQTLFFKVLKLKPLDRGTEKNGGEKFYKIDKKFKEAYKDVKEVALFTKLVKVEKLYNAYVKSFIKRWGHDADFRSDQRIRPHFQYTAVVTGRASAEKPSLHQIPSRSERGKDIKRIFGVEDGRIIIKVDYSAHEVRCFNLNSYVHTEVGPIKFSDFLDIPKVDKPKVKSFNHETKEVELKSVGTQSIHPPEDDMYEIEYEGGFITLTGNHTVWSQTRNAYIRVDEIEEDEEVIVDGNKKDRVQETPT